MYIYNYITVDIVCEERRESVCLVIHVRIGHLANILSCDTCQNRTLGEHIIHRLYNVYFVYVLRIKGLCL
jgi:hypothetical protein